MEEVRKEPLDLPEGLEWSDIDIKDPKQLDEVQRIKLSSISC